jgi:hypothetical protein
MGQKGNLLIFNFYTSMRNLEIFVHQEAIVFYFSSLNSIGKSWYNWKRD